MGKFEGYLICADIDGTFRMGDSVSENKKAVQYFMEHGGAFTFATGRSVAHLREEGLLNCMNAPACLCNGGIVYDYEKEKVLREERLPFSLGEFLEEIRKSKSEIQAMILFHSCEEESIVIANAAEESPMGCNNSCYRGCASHCSGRCQTTCNVSCQNHCRDNCGATCKYTCSGKCTNNNKY